MTGAVVWFTGLPSSGKSQFARRSRAQLEVLGRPCCVLDGDRVRQLLHPRPGYSAQERDDFYLTLGMLAVELSSQGLVVLVAATAHRRIYRDRVRALVPSFVEVWLNAPLLECRARDAKGLYADFAHGNLAGIPGEDIPYETPESPEITASGSQDDEAFERLLGALRIT
jgi:adenylylsulfate kinase